MDGKKARGAAAELDCTSGNWRTWNKTLRVLNLYAGIGGNRKLWPKNIEVTAVEINPQIAKIYKGFFPNDIVEVTDAHQYLLEHYDDGWDFIWSSPPCPTHSDIRRAATQKGQQRPVYPDMKLYEEIIFMETFGKCKYCIENVIAYYDPLIKPQTVHRHYFWADFTISNIHLPCDNITKPDEGKLGIDLRALGYEGRKDKIIRNTMNSELGLHIWNCAFNTKTLETWSNKLENVQTNYSAEAAASNSNTKEI